MRMLLAIVIVALSGATAWLLYSSSSPISGVGAVKVMRQEALSLDGMRIYEKKNNQRIMELVAARGVISLDETRTDLEKFTFVSHSDDTGDVTLTAERGTMINATHDVTARGSVLARDSEGRALLANSLKWLNSRREIVTDDKVWIFGDRFVITGHGMLVDVDAERMELHSGVKAVFQAHDE